ncbi:MAG: class I SAM-dependent RNA methyltransferase [Deltaproteobacteria bacterium]|nr:MAG: class I SAM-dependent RNA methyltransferase [Deltaproteobacteria bacterium]
MDEIEVVVDAIAAGGDGVARAPDGRVVFVARTAIGDRVRVRITESRRRYARGEIVAVVEPSADRVAPACPLFGDCGGCQWQHLSAGAQAAAKQAIVASALRRAVDAGMELRPLQSPAPPVGWRRRARLHWVRRRRGRGAAIGWYRPRSHRVVDVAACPQLEPALAGALEAVRGVLAPGLGGTGDVSLLAGHAGDVHVAIAGPHRPAAAEALARRPPVVGVVAGRRVWGAADIEVEPGLRGRADRFAQASRAGNAALIAAVDAACAERPVGAALELYAGSGNLSRALAHHARRVVAVDVAVGAPLAGVRWRKGDAAAVAGELAAAGERFDLVVIDPPRAGAADALDAVVALRPARIVYASCDPATLARDLDRLSAAGYAPRWAQPIDMMPQTAHVEVVVAIDAAPR